MKVSPNGYYNYRKHRKDAGNKRKASVLKKIERLYHEAGGNTGYRMMRELLDLEGIHLSGGTVRRYMNVELGLKSVTRRKRKCVYGRGPGEGFIFSNLLGMDFSAKERHSKLCVDFTYLFLENGSKRYNCTVIDLYDRAVLASVNGRKLDAGLAVEALGTAMKSFPGKEGVILHSDRGCQFTSREFTEFCRDNGIVQSMSKPGFPYDNSPMERYFNTLKVELVNSHRFRTEEELFDAVNRFAYGWYNNLRPHSYNGGLPPKKKA